MTNKEKEKKILKIIKIVAKQWYLLESLAKHEFCVREYVRAVKKEEFKEKDLAPYHSLFKELRSPEIGLLYITRHVGNIKYYRTSDFGIRVIKKISEMGFPPKEQQDLSPVDTKKIKKYINNIKNNESSIVLNANLEALYISLNKIAYKKWHEAQWIDNDGMKCNLRDFFLELLRTKYVTYYEPEQRLVLKMLHNVFAYKKPIIILTENREIDQKKSNDWYKLIERLKKVYRTDIKNKKDILSVLHLITDKKGDLPKEILNDFFLDIIQRKILRRM